MDQDKNRPRSSKAIAIRITTLVLALWMTFMGVLTWAVAQDFYRQIKDTARQIACYSYHTGYGTHFSEELPGYDDMIRMLRLGESYHILQAEQLLPFVGPQTPDSYGSDHWLFGKWNLLYGFQPSVIYYDEHDNVMLKSGNIFSFSYCAESSWIAQSPEVHGIAYIDMDAMPNGGKDVLDGYLWGWPSSDSPSSFYMSDHVLRLEGYFEGNRFIPITIDDGFKSSYSGEKKIEMLTRYDRNGALEWKNLYTTDAPEGVELTTVYSWEVGGYLYDHQSVTVNGIRFDSLVDLLEAAIADETVYSYHRDNLFDSIIIFSGTMEDDPGVGRYSLAIRCWPMQYAVLRMIPTFLVSLAVVALALWLILRKIRKSLTDPMNRMIQYLVRDYPISPAAAWKEPYALENLAAGAQQLQNAQKNEIQQLRTALDYARNAEENRRQMVSNITHELKTPLAIIHSYAEGLQTGIAGEKKDKYLSVILEEAERMDAMVLEMLDLSRLEAGKVKLATDHFSLLELTRSIAEKLTPAAEARELTISYSFTEDYTLTADESRIAQAVTNLITNAIKYTPRGGVIWIKTFVSNGQAHFYIENTGPHFKPEVLDKLFESFYRGDASRHSEGTGLGLAITRSIIELHRGAISVRNTWINGESCVEFHFSLPLV